MRRVAEISAAVLAAIACAWFAIGIHDHDVTDEALDEAVVEILDRPRADAEPRAPVCLDGREVHRRRTRLRDAHLLPVTHHMQEVTA